MDRSTQPATATALAALVETATAVRRRGSRLAKIQALADLLRATPAADLPLAVAFLTGELPRGKIGVGYKVVRRSLDRALAETAHDGTLEALTLQRVDQALQRIEQARGAGSQALKEQELVQLLRAASAEERDFLCRVLLGELRQGALAGIMTEAVASASGIAAAAVRRAAMVSGDLRAASAAALLEGEAGLARFRVELFRPIQPMLAQPAEDLDAALSRATSEPTLALELKIDGARIQVHRNGERIEVYTRSLNRVTPSLPEVVEAVARLPTRRLLLDGEVYSVFEDRSPRPFQDTMRRFGRKLDVAALRSELPLEMRFFDCLLAGDEELLDRPLKERWRYLEQSLPHEALMPQLRTADRDAARRFLEGALEEGHEGLMVKDLGSTYQAGSRGGSWLKVKPSHTLELVVLGAEWGSGRREGWLSNLHLGARDAHGELGEVGSFVMLGKTFKGLTDELLRWQTEALLDRTTERGDWLVRVRPELVVEVALNNVQASPQYPAGLALRFARVKRYRPDKVPAEASTLDEVRALFERERTAEARTGESHQNEEGAHRGEDAT